MQAIVQATAKSVVRFPGTSLDMPAVLGLVESVPLLHAADYERALKLPGAGANVDVQAQPAALSKCVIMPVGAVWTCPCELVQLSARACDDSMQLCGQNSPAKPSRVQHKAHDMLLFE